MKVLWLPESRSARRAVRLGPLLTMAVAVARAIACEIPEVLDTKLLLTALVVVGGVSDGQSATMCERCHF